MVTLVPLAVFGFLACATGIVMIMFLVGGARDKRVAHGPQHTLRTNSVRGVSQSVALTNSTDKTGPQLHQELVAKPVVRNISVDAPPKAAEPRNPGSFTVVGSPFDARWAGADCRSNSHLLELQDSQKPRWPNDFRS